jgi:hypothetical protein
MDKRQLGEDLPRIRHRFSLSVKMKWIFLLQPFFYLLVRIWWFVRLEIAAMKVLCHQNICKLLQVRYRYFFMNCFVDIVLSIKLWYCTIHNTLKSRTRIYFPDLPVLTPFGFGVRSLYLRLIRCLTSNESVWIQSDAVPITVRISDKTLSESLTYFSVLDPFWS